MPNRQVSGGVLNHEDSGTESVEQLLSDLSTSNSHILPLWTQMAKLNPPEPNPQCVPHIWRYDAVKPYLLRAGRLVTEKQAERRVLMLINPARGKASKAHQTNFRKHHEAFAPRWASTFPLELIEVLQKHRTRPIRSTPACSL